MDELVVIERRAEPLAVLRVEVLADESAQQAVHAKLLVQRYPALEPVAGMELLQAREEVLEHAAADVGLLPLGGALAVRGGLARFEGPRDLLVNHVGELPVVADEDDPPSGLHHRDQEVSRAHARGLVDDDRVVVDRSPDARGAELALRDLPAL